MSYCLLLYSARVTGCIVARKYSHLVSDSLSNGLLNMRDVFGLVTGVTVPVQLLHGAEPHPCEEEGHALGACTAAFFGCSNTGWLDY